MKQPFVFATNPIKKMSGRRSGSYSPMQSSGGGADAPSSSSSVTPKTILIFLVALLAVVIVLAVAAFALSAAGLQVNKSQSKQVSSTPPTSKPSSVPPTTASKVGQSGPKPECGDGNWKQVAYLDMTDPNQQCPKGWRGYSTPVRACGRPVSDRVTCAAVFFSTGGSQYSKVCGQARGYQKGTPDGFSHYTSSDPDHDTVNGVYIDGISVSYGNPRTHIWTFAVGLHENTGDPHDCPCDGGTPAPDFVGSNYFCETGDNTPDINLHIFYQDDPLWDGKNCLNVTCCSENNPPWFKVGLGSGVASTAPIEVRICGDQRTGDEDTPISYLELYVQ